MEVLIAGPLLIIPLFMPMIAGLMAKSFGRKFWPWFFIGIPLPLIANIILFCLPDKSKAKELKAVGNEELFDYLFSKEDSNHVTIYKN